MEDNTTNQNNRGNTAVPLRVTSCWSKPTNVQASKRNNTDMDEDNHNILTDYIADHYDTEYNVVPLRVTSRWSRHLIEQAKKRKEESKNISAKLYAKRLQKSILQVYRNAFHVPTRRVAAPKPHDHMDQRRPRAFIDISSSDGGRYCLGRLTIVLFPDIVPRTVQNFVELCQNHRRQVHHASRKDGAAATTKSPNYVGTRVHRVYPDLYIEMGDTVRTNNNATAAFCAENFDIRFDVHAGMLAMAPDADGKLSSRFLITLKPLSVLNGQRCCFGRVTRGFRMLQSIERQAHGFRLAEPLCISDCGILPPLLRGS